jgi:hypothetical protein
MLYRNEVNDIDRAKREQWSQFYAFKLVQAGVAGFSQRYHPESAQLVWIALVILMLLGLLVIGMHQLRLWRLRRLIEGYSEHLEGHSRELLKKKDAASASLCCAVHDDAFDSRRILLYHNGGLATRRAVTTRLEMAIAFASGWMGALRKRAQPDGTDCHVNLDSH